MDEEIQIGEPVKIRLLELYGYITAILLRGTWKQYEISYFSNGEYKTMWADRFQFDKFNRNKLEAFLKND